MILSPEENAQRQRHLYMTQVKLIHCLECVHAHFCIYSCEVVCHFHEQAFENLGGKDKFTTSDYHLWTTAASLCDLMSSEKKWERSTRSKKNLDSEVLNNVVIVAGSHEKEI